MSRADAHDRFRPCLVGVGNLVEEEEGHFILFVRNLDAVAVHRVEIWGEVDGYLTGCHAVLLPSFGDKGCFRHFIGFMSRWDKLPDTREFFGNGLLMEPISISSVIKGHFCPVRLYIERSGPSQESSRYTVCKQISSHLGGSLDLVEIWREICTIQPDIDPAMQDFLATCVTSCKTREWRRPVQTDVSVISEKFGMRGVVDKVYGEAPFFAITRSSEAPQAGIYTSDRLRVACYALCIRESMGIPADAGLVEYIPSGVVRLCRPEPRDRRSMIRGVRMAERVIGGEIPKKPVNAPCSSCPHEGKCVPGPHRLSDLW